MKKNRLSIKAVISLILSLILLCMPAVAFTMNGNYAMSVQAEDKTGTEEGTNTETESGSEGNSTEGSTENETATREDSDTSGDGMESSTENSNEDTEETTGDDMESSTENSTEDATEDGTVSGNEVPEPVCSCEDKCGAYEYDRNCPICAEDYKKCAYKKPNVTSSAPIKDRMCRSASTSRTAGTMIQLLFLLALPIRHIQAILRLPKFRQR